MTAVGGLNHDVLKLLNFLQRTLVLHRVLVLVIRLLAERTYCSHEALTVDGTADIIGRQTVLRQHIGFHPDAQGIGVT